MMESSLARRLEAYTDARRDEVLRVCIELDGEPDEILIFKGYSSSLMRPTATDPDIPVLSDRARIVSIDRLRGPYNPKAPEAIEAGMNWEQMEQRLANMGL